MARILLSKKLGGPFSFNFCSKIKVISRSKMTKAYLISKTNNLCKKTKNKQKTGTTNIFFNLSG
jgi:hypothetical protein